MQFIAQHKDKIFQADERNLKHLMVLYGTCGLENSISVRCIQRRFRLHMNETIANCSKAFRLHQRNSNVEKINKRVQRKSKAIESNIVGGGKR